MAFHQRALGILGTEQDARAAGQGLNLLCPQGVGDRGEQRLWGPRGRTLNTCRGEEGCCDFTEPLWSAVNVLNGVMNRPCLHSPKEQKAVSTGAPVPC